MGADGVRAAAPKGPRADKSTETGREGGVRSRARPEENPQEWQSHFEEFSEDESRERARQRARSRSTCLRTDPLREHGPITERVRRAPEVALRALHVGALPFPSPQGTQAAIASLLCALSEAGDDVRLLAFAHGARSEESWPFPVVRARERWPYRSLRSGPSLRKASADWALATSLRRELVSFQPGLLVAHHVEAAALALLADAPPRVFVAHTDLGGELPSYAASPLAPLLERCGGALDRMLVQRCEAVAAVSPWLVERLRPHATDERVKYLPVPWTCPPAIAEGERAHARRELALDAHAEVLGYAGNLDAYQGWPVLIALLAQLQARGRSPWLLVATASDPKPLWDEARRAGVGARVAVLPLEGEAQRRRVHAAIDLALVPRRIAGGVPIKLLDALSRGVACACTHTASAGLPLEGAAAIAEGDAAEHLAVTVERLLRAPSLRRELARRGPDYVTRAHAPRESVRAMHALDAIARRANS